ncbi:ABC transporter permease [Paenibacillus sp. WLX1005]|uniref:ABC transporter permease n=1 Tax=Paenibacillus sp. WLX1005 TaxID=3243766 RepID=UPI0039841863
MTDFVQLIWNEILKIVLRVSNWVMLILLVALSPALLLLLKFGDYPGSALMALEQSFAMFFLVVLFMLIVASESVASEFTTGTIKLLLIRPWQRWKILSSKFLAVTVFLLVLTLIFTLINLIVSYVLFPAQIAGVPDGELSSYENNLLLLIVYSFIRALILATFAFMLSALFRSSALAITLSMLLYFSGTITNGLLRLALKPDDYWIVKYLLFTNLDLTQYFSEPTGSFGVTSLGWSLFILAVYFVLFLLISWLSFAKRDVRS